MSAQRPITGIVSGIFRSILSLLLLPSTCLTAVTFLPERAPTMHILADCDRKFYPEFVKNPRTPESSLETDIPCQSLLLLEPKALPPAALDFLLEPKKDQADPFVRALAGLIQCEAHANKEQDLEWSQDCRQAWIALYKITKGEFSTFRAANVSTCYQIYGKHPDELPAAITAKRKAQLGAQYSLWYDANGNLRPDIPKKPSARNEIPPTTEKPMAESRGGDAPQKMCAYGAQEAKTHRQQNKDAGITVSNLTGPSCRTATKREAQRTLTSEFGRKARPAGVAATAGDMEKQA
jgi:hypothetical protein